ncbi:MAG: amidohydrolase family protein [Gemmatimonadota bacterium]
MRIWMFAALGSLAAIGSLDAQARKTRSPEIQELVSVEAPVVALMRVRVIDGTGAPAREDQTVIIRGGKIEAVGPAATVKAPPGARVIDGAGHTVIPGLIGLHDHTFYTAAGRTLQSNYSAPRLYLAAGVTTIRTTGSVEPYAELYLKKKIDDGEVPGPNIVVTGPYLTGPTDETAPSMARLKTAADARRVVAYWADEGVTWMKFYTAVSREAMKAAIDEGHKRGMKFTGHLCSVSHREAVNLGIDGLEHGMFANSDFDPTRKPDQCSPNVSKSFATLDVNGPAAQATFKAMVARQVALTSTLAVIETVYGLGEIDPRALEAMSPDAKTALIAAREAGRSGGSIDLLKKGMAYERAFVKAGGLLTSGVDPVNAGLFGYGDQRNIELLVEAGFSPVEAIQIGSANGAKALGTFAEVGSIAPGKRADLVLIRGNPAVNIGDLRQVVTVFKGGVGYDSAKLAAAVKGQVGIR